MSYWFIPGIKGRYGYISPKIRIKPALIITTVCEHLSISEYRLKTRGRKPEVVYARDLCVYFMRKYSKLNFPEIGQMFHRHHSTAMFANDKVNGLVEAKHQNKYQGDVDILTKLIFNKL